MKQEKEARINTVLIELYENVQIAGMRSEVLPVLRTRDVSLGNVFIFVDATPPINGFQEIGESDPRIMAVNYVMKMQPNNPLSGFNMNPSAEIRVPENILQLSALFMQYCSFSHAFSNVAKAHYQVLTSTLEERLKASKLNTDKFFRTRLHMDQTMKQVFPLKETAECYFASQDRILEYETALDEGKDIIGPMATMFADPIFVDAVNAPKNLPTLEKVQKLLGFVREYRKRELYRVYGK